MSNNIICFVRLIDPADRKGAGDFLGFVASSKALMPSQQDRKTDLKKLLEFVQNKLDSDMQGVVIYQFSVKMKRRYQTGLCRIYCIYFYPILSLMKCMM